jgi:2-methylaconitate cis-trans-isomerase PrpF
VRVFNTNTGKVFVARVPVADGAFEPEGEYAIQGVPGTGSRIVLDYLDPGGGISGALLPTGHPRDAFRVSGGRELEATLVDAGNPLVICRLADLGLTGLELPPTLEADAELMARLESLRARAAVTCGLARTPEEAGERSPAIPKVAFVGPPRAYTATDGRAVDAAEIDVLARMVSMGRVHTSYALTGAIATAVAAVLPDTVVYDLARPRCRESGWVRIGHPAGVLEVGVEVREVGGDWRVVRVSTARTARRLMDGYVYVPATAIRERARVMTGAGVGG